MEKIAEYNYYGIVEGAYKKGKGYYMSIIDYRHHDTRLSGQYDSLGVKKVTLEYVQKWMNCRGISH